MLTAKAISLYSSEIAGSLVGKFQIKGIDELEAKLSKMSGKVTREMNKALTAGALLVQKKARDLIKNQSAGKRVNRKNPDRVAMVSPKGSPPNYDQGKLSAGIVISKVQRTTQGFKIIVASTTSYGARLEYKLKRPFMRPALRKSEKKILGMVQKAVRVAIHGKIKK